MSGADSVETVEIVSDSRPDEARRVIDVVVHYLRDGGSVSDVAVVAPDLSTYEAPLTDAAAEYDLPTAVWTQLPLTDTLPYRLVSSLCGVLDQTPSTLDEFLEPIEYQWLPPSDQRGENTTGPLPPETHSTIRSALQAEKESTVDRPVSAWCDRAESVESTPLLVEYAEWIRNHRHGGAPSGTQVVAALTPILDAYEETVLPKRKEQDDATLSRTAQTARAVVRMQDLVEEVRDKYETRVADGMEPSWRQVHRLAETIGGLRAGRREHANARAIDVIDANDMWAMSRKVVIAVGLRQNGWIERPRGVLPAELRDRIVAGEGDVSALGFRAAYSDARVRDHFEDTIAAAEDTLVLTRPQTDTDGTDLPRSPLLAMVDSVTVNPSEVFNSE